LAIVYLVDSGSTSSVFSIFEDMRRNCVKPHALSFDKAYVGFLNENEVLEIEKLVKLIGKWYFRDMG